MLPRQKLKKAIVVAHHPVRADPPCRLQPEDLVQLPRARFAAVIILRSGRRPRKPPVVFRQILPLQIGVGLRVRGNLLAAQLLHQAILMRPVHPLHPSLGLRRTRPNQLDAELLAHAPKLRDRLLPPQLLPGRGARW